MVYPSNIIPSAVTINTQFTHRSVIFNHRPFWSQPCAKNETTSSWLSLQSLRTGEDLKKNLTLYAFVLPDVKEIFRKLAYREIASRVITGAPTSDRVRISTAASLDLLRSRLSLDKLILILKTCTKSLNNSLAITIPARLSSKKRSREEMIFGETIANVSTCASRQKTSLTSLPMNSKDIILRWKKSNSGVRQISKPSPST